MNEAPKKTSFSTIALVILFAAIVGLSILFAQNMSKMNNAFADIMQVEAISSTTQRQINLAENNEHTRFDVFAINDLTEKSLSVQGSDVISLMDNPSIAVLANEVLQQWYTIQDILSVNWNLADGEETKDLDYISMRLARDAHFKAMTDLSNGIGDYTQGLNDQINQYQFMITVLAFLITMILFNRGLQTRAELLISKELAQKAQIDTATGLYNRSRCQELFKSNQAISNLRKPAIMVLDLNDLKKTNDSLGHRVGDELIYSFASILKSACDVHTISPFIGRYGGDEFIVYYEDIRDEDELKVFLKELDFLTKEQNEKESRFQVSYAVGYSFVSNDSETKMTARQLFDKADEAMYVNKVEGKRAKNPNYDEEKAKGETR